MLTKEDIAAAEDFTVEPYKVPEWGGEIFLRTPCEADYCDYKNSRSTLIAMMLCDSNGKLMFHWRKGTDVEILNNKNPIVMDRIHDQCMRLSGLTKEADPIGDAEKNL